MFSRKAISPLKPLNVTILYVQLLCSFVNILYQSVRFVRESALFQRACSVSEQFLSVRAFANEVVRVNALETKL